MRHCRDPICWSRGRPTRSARRSQSRALANRSARSFRAEAVRAVSRHWSASRRYCSGLLAAPVGRYLDLLAAIGVHMVPPRFGCTSQLLDRAFTGRSRTMRALCRNRVPRVRGLPIAEIVARARARRLVAEFNYLARLHTEFSQVSGGQHCTVSTQTSAMRLHRWASFSRRVKFLG